MTFEIIVIGGGPIGIFCVFVLEILGFKNIALIESSDKLGGECIHMYPKKEVYDVAGIPKIKAEKLVEGLIEQMNHFKPTVYLNSQILSITKDEKGFNLKTNNPQNAEIHADRIIISSGKGTLVRRKPTNVDGFQQAEAKGLVQYSLSDPEIFRNKDVVIGGGGDSALDWYFALNGIARNIYIVHRSSITAMESSKEKLYSLIPLDFLMLKSKIQKIESILDESQTKQINKMLIISEDGEKKSVDFDFFIPCYGSDIDTESFKSMVKELKIKILDDGNIESKDYRTGEPGIYHVGKFDWLSVGFGHAVQAAQAASKDKKGEQNIPYSSSNPIFAKILAVFGFI